MRSNHLTLFLRPGSAHARLRRPSPLSLAPPHGITATGRRQLHCRTPAEPSRRWSHRLIKPSSGSHTGLAKGGLSCPELGLQRAQSNARMRSHAHPNPNPNPYPNPYPYPNPHQAGLVAGARVEHPKHGLGMVQSFQVLSLTLCRTPVPNPDSRPNPSPNPNPN